MKELVFNEVVEGTFRHKVYLISKYTLLENHNQINIYQHIYVDWSTAITDFIEFVTFAKTNNLLPIFLLIRIVQRPYQQIFSKGGIFLESIVIYWNI